MTLVLNRIIQNWEKSGQGDHGHINESSDIEDFFLANLRDDSSSGGSSKKEQIRIGSIAGMHSVSPQQL